MADRPRVGGPALPQSGDSSVNVWASGVGGKRDLASGGTIGSAREVREDPMSPAVNETYQGWTRQISVPELSQDAPPADGAWRVWELLRGWDQRFALAVDATLAVGFLVLCSGWFLFSRVPHSDLALVAGLTFGAVFGSHWLRLAWRGSRSPV